MSDKEDAGEFHLYGCPSCTAVYFHNGEFDQSTTQCDVCGFAPEESRLTWVNIHV